MYHSSIKLEKEGNHGKSDNDYFFHIHTVHLHIITVFLFTNWCTSELS